MTQRGDFDKTYFDTARVSSSEFGVAPAYMSEHGFDDEPEAKEGKL